MTETGGFSVGDEVVFKQSVPDGMPGPDEKVITIDGETYVWHRGEITGFSAPRYAEVKWDDGEETETHVEGLEIPSESQWYQEHVEGSEGGNNDD